MHQDDNISALYDHEHEGLRLDGKDRIAPDWGADDLFDGRRYPSSRRRFVRERERQRDVVDWFVEDGEDERSWSVTATRTSDRPAAGGEARLDPDARARLDPDAAPPSRGLDAVPGGGRRALDLEPGPVVGDAWSDGVDGYMVPAVDDHAGAGHPGRRTVTVTGHPDAVRRAERSGEIARRRPNPSLTTRLTDRPDRVAMYACALGLLLVIVAIATANA